MATVRKYNDYRMFLPSFCGQVLQLATVVSSKCQVIAKTKMPTNLLFAILVLLHLLFSGNSTEPPIRGILFAYKMPYK